MRKLICLAIALIEVAIFLLAVYFEPSYGVRGQLRGEAVFDGRPTSYWQNELSRWTRGKIQFRDRCGGIDLITFSRPLTTCECILALRSPFGERPLITRPWPRLLHAGAEAEPVLRELLDDPSADVRFAAHLGLGLDPEPNMQ